MVPMLSPPLSWQPFGRALRSSPPTPRRISAWSVTLVLHLGVLALLLAPRPPLQWSPPQPTPPIQWIEVPKTVEAVPLPLPLPLPQKPAPAERRLPAPSEPTPVVRQAPALPALQPRAIDVPVAPRLGAQMALPAAPLAAARAVAVDSVTPPPYPTVAARRGQQGTVMLRVLIGADGVPERVEVDRSSGHRELDRAARRHVLATWRFHAALAADGQPVRAWARVPIAFSLR